MLGLAAPARPLLHPVRDQLGARDTISKTEWAGLLQHMQELSAWCYQLMYAPALFDRLVETAKANAIMNAA